MITKLTKHFGIVDSVENEVSEKAAQVTVWYVFRSFLIDMNRVFQEFVSQVLHDRLRPPFEVTAQESRHHLGTLEEIPLRPDLIIRKSGRIVAVADCKYKSLTGGIDYRQHDYYQALAYCTALNTTRGVLIYSRDEIEVEDRVSIRNTRVTIERLSLDIGLEPHLLSDECHRLCMAITALQ